MSSRTIKRVAGFAGGKGKLAPRIVDLLGPHDFYAEPFVGGCSILAAKPDADTEWLNDVNPRVVDVLIRMRDSAGPLARRLAAVDYSRETFDFARAWLRAADEKADDFQRTVNQLIVWWMGPGGMAGTDRKPWFSRRHTETGGSPAVRWKSFVRSLPALCERLAFTRIYRLDFGQFVERIPDRDGVAIYADPPYLETTRTVRYEFDFSPGDHWRLSDALHRFQRTRVIVNYYDSPLLSLLYPPDRWEKIVIEGSKNMASAGGRTSRAIEVLLVNRRTSC